MGLVIAIGERWRFTSAVRARFDPQDEIEPGQPDQRERSSYNRRLLIGDTGEVELRDFYVDGALGPVTLRVGKQQVVWGQADSLRVLDVVNPHSFREFVLPKPEDRRIPLWTVNMEAPLGGALLQLLWLPDPTYDEIPLDDEPFAVTSPLFVPRAPAGVPTTVAAHRAAARALRIERRGREALRISWWLGPERQLLLSLQRRPGAVHHTHSVRCRRAAAL